MNLALAATVLLTMEAYHITQWHRLYEGSETRKTDYMSWYKKPTKLVGVGIGLTLAHVDNLKLLGTWTLIETIASLSAAEERGWLVRNRVALDAEDMHGLIPSVKAAEFQSALDWFSGPRINWLERLEFRGAPELAGNSPGKVPGNLPLDNGTPAIPLLTGNSPGKVPGLLPTTWNAPGEKAPREREREIEYREIDLNKEIKKAASPEEAKQQSRQFSATQGLVTRLEEIPEDDRTPEQERELKKMRRRIRLIQKKQSAGDFTPVNDD